MALKRLRADVEARRVDCVVYKADRLSRNIRDFAKIMELCEKHDVSFVSVTQQFNTTTSLGRLTLNTLPSFAQFERELISERTRDKISGAQKKGKWTGSHLILGYDLDPRATRLLVNPTEAEQVRSIFQWYLEGESVFSIADKVRWPVAGPDLLLALRVVDVPGLRAPQGPRLPLLRDYVCLLSKEPTDDYCTARAVSAPSVEEAVVESIRRVSVHPRVLEETAFLIRRRLADRASEVRHELNGAQQKLKNLKSQVARIREPDVARESDLNGQIASGRGTGSGVEAGAANPRARAVG